MKLTTLKKKLEKIDCKIEVLKIERRELRRKIEDLCEHPRVVKSGGGMWHDWPNYGCDPYHLSCTECTLSISSDDSTQRILYDILSKRIVKDTSEK